MGVVAEVFRHGQRSVADAKSGAGRLVHLAEHQHGVIEHPRGLHVAHQLLRFPGALADAAEDGDAPVAAGDIVDKLRDQHGLPHACAAEQASLAATLQGSQEVDRLDAGDEDLGRGALLGQRYRRGVQGAPLAAPEVFPPVNRVAEHVDDAAQQPLAHRDSEGMARVEDGRAAGKPGSGGQGNAPDGFRVEMADHFDDDAAVFSGPQFAVEFGEAVGEAGVHDAAAHRQHGAPAKVVVIVHCASLLKTVVAHRPSPGFIHPAGVLPGHGMSRENPHGRIRQGARCAAAAAG